MILDANLIVAICLFVMLAFKLAELKRNKKDAEELWEYSERLLDIHERRKETDGHNRGDN